MVAFCQLCIKETDDDDDDDAYRNEQFVIFKEDDDDDSGCGWEMVTTESEFCEVTDWTAIK